MIIDIITVILFVVVALKFIIIEVRLDELSKRLEDTISRNNVQHENIEKEVHYIKRQYHIPYIDTDSIKVEKEGNNDN